MDTETYSFLSVWKDRYKSRNRTVYASMLMLMLMLMLCYSSCGGEDEYTSTRDEAEDCIDFDIDDGDE